MAKLLLVRHGLTEYNSDRRFAGYSDVQLSARGIWQSEKLRDRLADEHIDFVYASDLKRALTTATILSAPHKLQVVLCPELREMNYGDAEGMTFKEISTHYPVVADMCANFNPELKFPGGESFPDFLSRTTGFLNRLKNHKESETVLVISHSGPLRNLVDHLLGMGPEHWWQIRIDNASLSIVDTYPQGAILSLLNDVSHLKE